MRKLVGSMLIALAGLATPAAAQGPDDFVVMGRHGYYGSLRDAPSLSQAVPYDDLDLRTQWGWDELRYRVSQTSRYLCNRLGETDTSSSLVPSCRAAATRDAMRRVGTGWETYAPDRTVWLDTDPIDPRYDTVVYGDRYYRDAPYRDDRYYEGDPYGWGPPYP